MDDLAELLSPPLGTKVHFGQGYVESWDAQELRNTVLWKGAHLYDLPTVSGLSALTIDRGDSVALLGWENQNGVSTWWVTGKVVPPGEEASNLTMRGGGFLVVGDGGGIGIDDGGSLDARYASGAYAAYFGRVASGGEPIGHGLLILSEDDAGPNHIFSAVQNLDGSRIVRIGFAPDGGMGPVDSYSSYAISYQNLAYGNMRLQTLDGADIQMFSAGDLWIDGDDVVTLQSQTGPARFGGTGGTFMTPESGSGSANARIDPSSGRVTVVSGSTERIKRDITDFEADPEAVLRLRPRSWLPGPVERHCPPWMHEQHADTECHAGEVIDPPEDARREVGFIAEELDELGLGDFVEYDEEGLPASIRYDRLTAALVPLMQQQQDQIDALTERLNALEGS